MDFSGPSSSNNGVYWDGILLEDPDAFSDFNGLLSTYNLVDWDEILQEDPNPNADEESIDGNDEILVDLAILELEILLMQMYLVVEECCYHIAIREVRKRIPQRTSPFKGPVYIH